MATTESSAVIRLINSVQAQPIFDSFHEPISDPGVGAPPMPPLSHGTGTIIVGQHRRRWPLFLLVAIGLTGIAIGVGYVIGNSGPKAPQPAAGAVPALANSDRGEAKEAPADEAPVALPAVATEPAAEAEQQAAVDTAAEAEPAVAAAPEVEEIAPAVAYDAAFDIIVQPAGAVVSLDGKELGPAPLRIGRLAAGAHVVDVAAPEGYEGQQLQLDLVSGERQVVRVELEFADTPAQVEDEVEPEPVVHKSKRSHSKHARRSSNSEKRVSKRVSSSSSSKATSSSGSGTLMLGSKPPCKIFIDGKNTGLLTPQRALKLSAGKHKITLVNKDHNLKASTTVTIKAGETKRLIKDMSGRL